MIYTLSQFTLSAPATSPLVKPTVESGRQIQSQQSRVGWILNQIFAAFWANLPYFPQELETKSLAF
ncbi:hypothetical protein [Pseudophaeobacter sp.]|uniref:hypothetical protein n=1 Tax=Pseudophaeobacter sp. TaxID=1971739 RepID=UPI003299785D